MTAVEAQANCLISHEFLVVVVAGAGSYAKPGGVFFTRGTWTRQVFFHMSNRWGIRF